MSDADLERTQLIATIADYEDPYTPMLGDGAGLESGETTKVFLSRGAAIVGVIAEANAPPSVKIAVALAMGWKLGRGVRAQT